MPRKVSTTNETPPRSRKTSTLEPEKSRKISIFEGDSGGARVMRKVSLSNSLNGSSENLKSSRRISVRRRDDIAALIHTIDESLINKNASFSGPYGRRRVCYCDYAECGRSLQFVEDFIVKEVLQYAGDGRHASSITSIQSALFRQEAEDIVRKTVRAADKDDVIFVNRGRSSMVELIQRLGLLEICQDASEFGSRPVLFVASCQSVPSLAPWQKIGAKIVRINETRDGVLDLDDLEYQLINHQSGWGPLVGLFTAADPATGRIADDVATTLILHQHKAIACWDYTQAGPFVQLDMNPSVLETSAVCKDVMLFSVSKFLGGAQTPDVIVMKKSLVKRQAVMMQDYDDSDSFSLHVNCARAGLVLQIHETVGAQYRFARQEKINRTVLTHLKNIPEIILLGCYTLTSRLPIFTFLVRHPRGTYLHHNFVSAVLNDVFGIQTRSFTADSHFQRLLGIDDDLNSRLTTPILRPGVTRISLPYTTSDNELAFVLEALKMAATEAWKLLPQYKVDEKTGEWRHYSQTTVRDRKLVTSARLVEGRLCLNERKISTQNVCPSDYSDCLHVARCMFNKARKMAQKKQLNDLDEMLNANSDRWYMDPSDAEALLLGKSHLVKQTVSFVPNNNHQKADVKPQCSQVPMCQSPPSLHQSLHQIFNPKVILGSSPRQRCNSLGSVMLRGRNFAYSASLPDGDGISTDCRNREGGLQAYVSEVTRELATEIKSELREVISQVEQSEVSRAPRMERTDSLSAASASDIAEYLMGVSREMAKEVKTEIRELVSSVVQPSPPSPPLHNGAVKTGRTKTVSESRDSGINLSWSPDLQESVIRSNSIDSDSYPIRKANRNWKRSEVSSESSNDEAPPSFRWLCPPKSVWRATLEAVDGLQMIQANDTILIDLGSPHGFALLHTFHQLQLHFSARLTFNLYAVCDRSQNDCLEALGVPAINMDPETKSCSCSRRKDLMDMVLSVGCNVIALSDCLDDFAESFLLSVFHGGRLKAMKAQTKPINGVRVIRPFVYVREKSLKDFADSKGFNLKEDVNHPTCSNCSLPRQKERERCRELLLQQEALFPHLFSSLRSALHPLIGSKYSEERIPMPDKYATDSDDPSIVYDS